MIANALLGLTVVTGMVDAVSFLSLGRVFTANMTGNVVILAFASTGVAGLSVARSLTALCAFLAGAALGGRIMSAVNADTQIRAATVAFAAEIALLVAATICAIGFHVVTPPLGTQLYGLIVLTALAMGTRNAAVRKLAVPDLTTTVLTLTITGFAADSSLAGGSNPRWGRRATSVLAMFAGAACGAILIRHSVSAALALATALSLVSSLALFASIRSAARIQGQT
jgi:uncharacterized membrane protein YoaK (UPF0700 family)